MRAPYPSRLTEPPLPTPRGDYVVFYDGSCRICRRSRDLVEHLNRERKARMRWVNAADAQELKSWPQVDAMAPQERMIVLDPSGRLHGGYDAAIILLAAVSPMLRRLRPILLSGPVHSIGRQVYQWVANHRHCADGV